MTNAFAGFLGAIGLALIITAATLPGRQTTGVINSIAWGGTHLAEAALGQKP
jgi:hypothetical protein